MAKYTLEGLEEIRKTRSLTKNEQSAWWRMSNPVKVRACARAHYKANTEKYAAKKRKRRARLLAANPDCEREISQRWRDNHPNYSTDWYAANAEKRRADALAAAKAEPEKRAAFTRKRRALKLAAPGSHTQEEIDALFIRQSGHCANPYCCVDLSTTVKHLDHRQAISKGGSNSIENLQWLCRSCNTRKRDKDESVWLQREAERFKRLDRTAPKGA